MTASHCFMEPYDSIVWMNTTKKGTKIVRKAEVIDFNHPADWAVILLDKVVDKSEIEPVGILDEATQLDSNIGDFVSLEEGYLYIAGYSGDAEFGKDGTVLTYEVSSTFFDSEESEKYHEIFPNRFLGHDINSVTFGGASGGGIIFHWDSNYDGTIDTVHLIGVLLGVVTDSENYISSNGARGGVRTVLSAVNEFRERVKPLLDTYNR
ncbi:MAG: hypothetical protein ACRBBW_18940 [Cellvibrionaceae bacterium]